MTQRDRKGIGRIRRSWWLVESEPHGNYLLDLSFVSGAVAGQRHLYRRRGVLRH